MNALINHKKLITMNTAPRTKKIQKKNRVIKQAYSITTVGK